MGASSKGADNAPPDSELTKTGGPWLPAQGPLKGAIKSAEDLYKSGGFQQGYGPSVIPGFTDAQQAALSGMIGTAGTGQDALAQSFNNVVGLSGYQAPNTNVQNDVAQNGVQGPAYGQLQQTLGKSMNDGSLGYMKDAAAGGNMNNPYLEAQIGAATRGVSDTYRKSVMPGVEGRMAQTGRLGSGSEMQLRSNADETFAKNIGEIETGMRGNQYQFERGMQQQAGMALPGATNAQTNTQIGAAQAVNQDAYSRLNQQLSAASAGNADSGEAARTALSAATQVGGAYGNQFLPYQQMMQAGSMQQDQQAQQMAEQRAMFQQAQSGNYDALNRYIQTLTGTTAGSNPAGAAQYMTAKSGGPSGTEVAISNATALAAAGASAYNPKSDIRVKHNIIPVGRTPGGHNWYLFQYIGDPTPRQGVMAQEVAETRPDLVYSVDGVLHVNYGGIS